MPDLAIGLPGIPGFSSCDWRLRRNAAEYRSPLNQSTQSKERAGARWRATLQAPPYNRNDGRALNGFLSQIARRDRYAYISPPQQELPTWCAERVPDGTFLRDSWSSWEGNNAEVSINARRLKVKNLGAATGTAKINDDAINGYPGAFTRASVGMYWDQDGVYRTAPANVPRLDYNPKTKVLRGILMEAAAFNLVRYSNVTLANWVDNGNHGGGQENAGFAPDGTFTSFKIQSTGTWYRTTQTALTAGGSYCASNFFKPGTAATMRLYLDGAAFGGANPALTYSFITGAFSGIGSNGVTAGHVEDVGNGWYRMAMAFTSPNAGTANFHVLNSAGDISPQEFWGGQIEGGSRATSLMQTNGADGARAIEDLGTLFATAGLTLGSDNSVYVEFTDGPMRSSSTVGHAFAFIGATTNEFLSVGQNGLNNRLSVITGGSTVVALDGGTGASMTTSRVAARLKASNWAISSNGAAAVTQASGAFPTLTQYRHGTGPGFGSLNGWLRKVVVYNAYAVSNADLATLSGGGSITSAYPAMSWDFTTGAIGRYGFICEAEKPHVLIADMEKGNVESFAAIIYGPDQTTVEQLSSYSSSGRMVLPFQPSGTSGQLSLGPNTVVAGNYVYFKNVSIARCLLVDGGGQTGNTLNVRGAPNSTVCALRAGDFVTFRGGSRWQMVRLTDDFDSDASGKGTLVFEPAIRDVPLDGESIVIRGAFARFRKIEPEAQQSITPPNFSGFAFDLEEDLNVIAGEIQSDMIWGWDAENLSLAPTVGSGTQTFTGGGTRTRKNSAGLVELSAVDNPRFDYDPITKVLRGLLTEGTRSNSALFSEQLDNAVWQKNQLSVTPNATTAPDGTVSADKLVDTAASANHHLNQPLAQADNAIVCTSGFAKAGERSIIQIQVQKKDGTYANAWFNLATGAIGTVNGGAVAFMIPEAFGFYRCALSVSVGAGATTPSNLFRLATADNSETYAGDGTSGLFLWGTQVENGYFPSSYMPAGASAVTRNDDSCSLLLSLMTGNNASSQLSAYVEGMHSVAPLGSALEQSALSFSDNLGSNTNAAYVRRLPQTAEADLIVNTSVGIVDTGFTGGSASAAYKQVIALESGNYAHAYNGTLQTSSAVGYPSGLTIMRNGAGIAANNRISEGWQKRIRVFRRRIPNQYAKALAA